MCWVGGGCGTPTCGVPPTPHIPTQPWGGGPPARPRDGPPAAKRPLPPVAEEPSASPAEGNGSGLCRSPFTPEDARVGFLPPSPNDERTNAFECASSHIFQLCSALSLPHSPLAAALMEKA